MYDCVGSLVRTTCHTCPSNRIVSIVVVIVLDFSCREYRCCRYDWQTRVGLVDGRQCSWSMLPDGVKRRLLFALYVECLLRLCLDDVLVWFVLLLIVGRWVCVSIVGLCCVFCWGWCVGVVVLIVMRQMMWTKRWILGVCRWERGDAMVDRIGLGRLVSNGVWFCWGGDSGVCDWWWSSFGLSPSWSCIWSLWMNWLSDWQTEWPFPLLVCREASLTRVCMGVPISICSFLYMPICIFHRYCHSLFPNISSS